MAPNDAEAAFLTFSNYTEAFSRLCSGGSFTRGPLDFTASALAGWRGAVDSPATNSVDLAAVERSLRHAWGTELLLSHNLELHDDEVVRIANTWTVVQTYYVAYHATQALWIAKGNPRPTAHPTTQSHYADLWTKRSLYLPPLTVGFDHNGARNVAAGVSIDSKVHPWSACTTATCWSLVVKALETTREDDVAERRKKKRKQKQADKRKAWRSAERNRVASGAAPRVEPPFPLPRLTPAEKTSIDQGRPFGLIDYLYRLRIKANYVDAGIFVDGPTDTSSSSQLARNLSTISSVLLLGHEHRVSQLVGAGVLGRWMDGFIAANSIPSRAGIALRRPYYPIL
jgi:hypothetical protein